MAFCYRCMRLAARFTVPVAWALAIIHPLIHGTPLDQGALDAFIQAGISTPHEH